MRGLKTAVAAFAASLFALGAARADPLGSDGLRPYTPIVVEAKDQLKHYRNSYIIEPIPSQGSAPSIAALASGSVGIIPIGYSTLLTAVDQRLPQRSEKHARLRRVAIGHRYDGVARFREGSIDVKRYLDLSLVQEAAKRLP